MKRNSNDTTKLSEVRAGLKGDPRADAIFKAFEAAGEGSKLTAARAVWQSREALRQGLITDFNDARLLAFAAEETERLQKEGDDLGDDVTEKELYQRQEKLMALSRIGVIISDQYQINEKVPVPSDLFPEPPKPADIIKSMFGDLVRANLMDDLDLAFGGKDN